jgi:hypothetical protein
MLAVFVGVASAAGQGTRKTEAELVVAVSSAGSGLHEDAQRLGPMHSGSLGEGGRAQFGFVAPAGRCVVAIAEGEPRLEELRVTVGRNGRELARAKGEGEVQARWCAGEQQSRVRMTLKAARGRGRYAAAAFALPKGVTKPQSQGRAPSDGASPAERLQRRVERAGQGFEALTPVQRQSLEPGERVVRELAVRPGRCYRVLAEADSGIDDVDLAWIGPGGRPLQEDQSDEARASLGVLRPLCPTDSGSYRLALRAEKGSGQVAWRVLGSDESKKQQASDNGGDSGKARSKEHRVGGSGSGFVASRIRGRHREVGKGAKPVTGLFEGDLQTNEKKRFSVELQGGHCYVAIAAGVPSVRELDLRLLDPFGNEAGTDASKDAFPAARVCPHVAGRYEVELRMFNGYGRVGVQVFRAR